MPDYPIDMSVKPDVKAFFDPQTNTVSYVVKDPASASCAVIDSVMALESLLRHPEPKDTDARARGGTAAGPEDKSGLARNAGSGPCA